METKMKKDFFKPEDFELLKIQSYDNVISFAASVANEKLNQLIESMPVIYGTHMAMENYYKWTVNKNVRADKMARLAFVEELPKEPCNHNVELSSFFSDGTDIKAVCYHCGTELIATLSENK